MAAFSTAVRASPPMPRMPPEQEAAPWQRAGLEAALADPDPEVLFHALDYGTRKKWVAQLHLPTTQWLKWLGHENAEVRACAGKAAGQLGTHMPPEVQRALLHLQDDKTLETPDRRAVCEALQPVGPGLTPEVQLALVALLQRKDADSEQLQAACLTLGGTAEAMTPTTQQALLALLHDTRTTHNAGSYAADALARLGTHMPQQMRQAMLDVLLDARADSLLRCHAAEAMGRLGPQMPPQARQLLLSTLRDPMADSSLRYVAASALAQLGPQMPTDVQQALLAAFLQSTLIARQASVMVDGFALQALAGTRPPAPAVLAALLRELQDPAATTEVRESISRDFLQPLAEGDALPPEVQHALLTTAQDGRASPELRGLAALTLGHLGAHTSAEIRQALLLLLQDQSPDPALRFSAAEAMVALGSHMPPEAAPTLVRMILTAQAEDSAPPPPFRYELGLVQFAVPALGNLGAKMSPEAQAALLAVIQHPVGFADTPWNAAYALAQMGDKLPPQTQQRLLALQYAPGVEWDTRLAIRRTLGVSGLHPVSDAQVAELLTGTYGGGPDTERRFYLYLWLGRTPAHLQAVRWLGRTDTEPLLGDTPAQEVLGLVSRFWPHSAGADAGHAALRQAMARRTSQMMAALLKAGALDEPTRKVLAALSTQLAEDTTADCATALRQVQAALAAGK